MGPLQLATTQRMLIWEKQISTTWPSLSADSFKDITKLDRLVYHYTDQGRTLDCRSTRFKPRNTRTTFLVQDDPVFKVPNFNTAWWPKIGKSSCRIDGDKKNSLTCCSAIQKETTQQVQYIETFTGRFYYFTGTNSFYLDCSSNIRPNEKQQALSCKRDIYASRFIRLQQKNNVKGKSSFMPQPLHGFPSTVWIGSSYTELTNNLACAV